MPDHTEMDPEYDVDNVILALISNPSWTVRAKIDGKPVQMIVDTRSVVSVVDVTVFKRIGGVMNDLKPYSTDLHAAGGHSLEVLGCNKMQLCVDSHCADLDIVVAKLGLPIALLGMDYLSEFDCVLHLTNGVLRIDEEEVMLETLIRVCSWW